MNRWNLDPNQPGSITNLDEETEGFVTKKQKKQSNSTQKKLNSSINANNTNSANNGALAITTKPAPRCPRLRIFKNDVRRSYTCMVANALNSMDFNFIRAFFKRFAVPQIGFVMSHDPCGTYDAKYNSNFLCNLAGSEAIACYLGVLTYSTPDYVFSVSDTQIKVRSDCPGSVITCQYQGTGTFQYECTLEAIATDLLKSFAEFSKPSEPDEKETTTQNKKEVTAMEVEATEIDGVTGEILGESTIAASTLSTPQDPSFTIQHHPPGNFKKRKVAVETNNPNYAKTNILHQPTKMTANIGGKTLTTTTTLSETEMSCFMAYVSRIEKLTSKKDRQSTDFLAPVRIPYTYTVNGQMTMMIDEEKRIQSIVFHRMKCFYSVTACNSF